MIMRTKNHPVIPILLAALLLFAIPAQGHAEDLFRFYPEFQASGLASDNIPLRTNHEEGDFVGTLIGGFFLDYTSAARYASLHYDTFAQLFARQSRYDRAGEGQYVKGTDDEYLSPTTRLRLDEFFYRDSPTVTGIVASEAAPEFNIVAAQLLLASDQASINQFGAQLSHYWGHNWSSELSIHQTTFWNNGGNSNSQNNTSYDQSVETSTEYHFAERFSLGLGYRFYDFIFTYPGRPGEQAHWPYVKASWQPLRNLYLSGTAGVVISYTQGNDRQTVNFGGMGLLAYDLQRAHLRVYGGQQPELTSGFGGAGNIRGVRGELIYDFTQRVSGNAGGGFYENKGTGFDGQLISWGFGVGDRVNKWLSLFARFVQIRRNETSNNQFLPPDTENGKEATGNYVVVGFSASVEAFRWSWQ
jgi:hypothetical protein